MRVGGYQVLLSTCLVVAGCSSEDKPPPLIDVAPPSATASSSTMPGAAPAGAVCVSEERKSWGKYVNARTGLTPAKLKDGSTALGVAIGNQPHALVFDAQGQGILKRLPVHGEHPLAKDIPAAEGSRALQRVTLSAGLTAFADFRDKYKDNRRRIHCGPLGNAKPILGYEGKPLLDVDDSGADRSDSKKAPAPAPAASTSGSVEPAASAAPDPSAEPAPPPAPTSDDGDVVRELRDCRTFANADASDIWAVGSELVGERMDNGQRKWTMHVFTAPKQGNAGQIVIHKIPLSDEPKKLLTLEAPVAHGLADGNFVLAGRYQGRMLTWLLGAGKGKKSELQQYGGGYPSLPRLAVDGDDHLLLTSQQVDLSHWKLRALRLSKPSKLQQELIEPAIEGDSLAEPTFARIGDQRWLAYHAGDRRKGKVTIVPVDDQLNDVGQPFTLDEQGAYESFLLAVGDRLVLVYITRAENNKPSELVTERLRCTVQR
jgi:hypothetical protein